MKFGWRVVFKNCWVMVSVVKIGSMIVELHLWVWMNFSPCLQHCSIRVRFCGRLHISLWTYIQLNLHVYQETVWLSERLRYARALRHRTFARSFHKPAGSSSTWGSRTQFVQYVCDLTLRFEMSNCGPCFKAGVCVVSVLYRFFLHNVKVICLR
jgi:hypothetical protein